MRSKSAVVWGLALAVSLVAAAGIEPAQASGVAGPTKAESGSAYLTLFNRAPDDITRVSIAPAGTSQWRTLDTGRLNGGGNQVVVSVPMTPCLYTVRFIFAGGHPTEVLPRWNACRGDQTLTITGDYRRGAL